MAARLQKGQLPITVREILDLFGGPVRRLSTLAKLTIEARDSLQIAEGDVNRLVKLLHDVKRESDLFASWLEDQSHA